MNSKNTIVYVKVPGRQREGFVDPPPFEWNQHQDRKLWAHISTIEDKDDIDWQLLSNQTNAPEFFIRKRVYQLFRVHLKSIEQEIYSHTSADRAPNRSSQAGDEPAASVGVLNGYGQNINDIHDLSSLQTPPTCRGKANKDEDGGNSSGISELSSLSVSKSALEEALMDRLQL
ncbi:AAL098Wp [Eremothecium gossypii ATCC 10895]|uniref:Autophagy-related protein 29 n=1 Tax=Eremothecium gossypii (strain ATCC 10895 / CBS 109.51 / FGSC 9923 / NRRL Y-1056) TaxID=284811 RepID=ATG29_EREGS|nr:AAL098Wp [Eremothecium gossypii ATCC 10895]Q75F26.1 RecName: Full=Autophagy-related protein 29 [Eremothecium gossypii ATCC 10895]AAS50268.1 AAL098Wp [Eremothecium gossypii ATCC 10895]AEY94553.1 FAAL098Wp [Eremothecium gossypii FDAG1]